MLRGHRTTRSSLAIAALGPLVVLVLVAPAAAADTGVSISGFAFNPGTVTVTAGDTVTWTNEDGVAHTVTADDASFDSGSVGPAATFAWTFSSPGTFAYHCQIHPGMNGSVTVLAAATAPPGAGASPPPTTTGSAASDGPATAWLFALVAIAGVAGALLLLVDHSARRHT